jgi:hypothetical protein
LLIDVTGYFAAGPGGLALYTIPTCRALDTRLPGRASFEGTKDITMPGSTCSGLVSSAAQAYLLGIVAVPPEHLGFLTLWDDAPTQPGASNLNSWGGADTSNMAIVAAPNGSIHAFASETTHLVLDIYGYFAP